MSSDDSDMDFDPENQDSDFANEDSSDSHDDSDDDSVVDEEDEVEAREAGNGWAFLPNPFQDKRPNPLPVFRNNFDIHLAVDMEACLNPVDCFETFF